eukprot:TRINITY_DN11310_c0_g1_i1.p1 TRINITY_DN11310_c0_g1~~TRINITY_DN11310_c0_g1_i1.p1  ORF type:complete len:161 (-),score=21.80 TRINITY_DN11310_c0_g1_i1:86-568(-)
MQTAQISITAETGFYVDVKNVILEFYKQQSAKHQGEISLQTNQPLALGTIASYSLTTFGDFLETWKKSSFSTIHSVRPKDLDKEEYIDALFQVALTHLQWEQPFFLRLGAFYTIYLLYNTQPFDPKRVVLVTCEQWNVLGEFIHRFVIESVWMPGKFGER